MLLYRDMSSDDTIPGTLFLLDSMLSANRTCQGTGLFESLEWILDSWDWVLDIILGLWININNEYILESTNIRDILPNHF